jgi:hypothetical protein
VVFDSDAKRVLEHRWEPNGVILQACRVPSFRSQLVIEQIESFGMAVGQEVFTTVWWAGRFFEAWPGPDRYMLARRPVKLHLCGSMKAKDGNIRQALIDKFGGEQAIGRKASPGPLYGVRSHSWSSLALAVTWAETHDQAVATSSPA